ncbi:NADH-quinone oxidoreductase subunit NuoN [Thermithiobacillus plumbiphilus]|uniref:NADH-quinone oxidoreductase subunit N n=1 Tax=Thermithiobacillus plumbiphilus TaxID=1729899 RepID=A0ABU9D9U6_9PROT
MGSSMSNWFVLAPEIFVTTLACGILIFDLFLKESQRGLTYLLTQATLVGATLLVLQQGAETALAFDGMFVLDTFAKVVKIFLLLAVFLALAASTRYLRDRGLYRGEYFVLILFAMVGMMIMASAGSLLTVYLGLELLALCQYALVAMRRDDPQATEAGLKYFILGALSSGMLLYGMSLLYGATGSLSLQAIANTVAASGVQDKVLVFALVFVMVGIAFKLGAAPFHMWVPDVYQGAPTAVTLFISTAPKLAAFAMAVRLVISGMAEAQAAWGDIFMFLSVLSILIGNVVAIAQTNLKRMLAYSGISHAGFLLLGLVTGDLNGLSSALFYTLTYILMGIGSFAMIMLLASKGFEAEEISDFKGLNQRHPWYAGMMMILMFSMAGVPPTVGFYAKLAVLQSVIQAGHLWLAVYAVILSVVGAFYYLRVVKVMYFDAPENPQPIQADNFVGGVVSLNSLMILILGLAPGALMTICVQAVQGLF